MLTVYFAANHEARKIARMFAQENGCERMTLIVTEIAYYPRDKDASRILCAADRRLSRDGKPVCEERKLFKNDRLNATVSYFGLSSTDEWTFEELLVGFLESNTSPTLEEFANSLLRHLNAIVPKHILRKNASGLHVTGFTDLGVPQFWFIRNIGGMDGAAYINFKEAYWLSEELSSNQAKDWYDAGAKDFTESFQVWYANGDLRSHQPAWVTFDAFVREMEARGLARPPASASDYEKRLRFKMEAIGLYYTIIADEVIVGGGTDTFILPHDGR
jgi:hypothetical protein